MRVKEYQSLYIAITASLIINPFSVIAATPVNSVNDGRIIQGGTYYNTPDGVTKFINSGSGGLWLKHGSTVNGKEVDATGSLTNRGGTLQLYAPSQVVRIDGNIDVNGLLSPQGVPIGDGGSVRIDAGYLYQNGNIYANGYRGGIVEANVGGMALGQGAQIQVKALDPHNQGGVVYINSSGPVDLRRFSVIENAGLGFEGSHFISVTGSVVNVDGTIKANGIEVNNGTIRLISTGHSNLDNLKTVLQNATQNPQGDSSSPTLTAQERLFLLQRANSQIQNHDGDVVIGRDLQHTNPIYIGQLNANGLTPEPFNDDNPGGSGSIIVNASRDIVNQGIIVANGTKGTAEGLARGSIGNFSYGRGLSGGDGGTISLIAMNNIHNQNGRIEANGGDGNTNALDFTGLSVSGKGTVGGHGGQGGLITLGYHTSLTNTGSINAKGGAGGSASVLLGGGGKGGLVVFSGDANPTGKGRIDVSAGNGGSGERNYGGPAGTIVSPNPSTLGLEQNYLQQGYVNGRLVSNLATEQTRITEAMYDLSRSTMIFLTKNGGYANPNLLSRVNNILWRTVDNPIGFKSDILTSYSGSSFLNVVIGSSQNNLTLDLRTPKGFPPPNNNGQVNPLEYLGSQNIVNNGSVILPTAGGGNFWLGSPFLGDRVSILHK